MTRGMMCHCDPSCDGSLCDCEICADIFEKDIEEGSLSFDVTPRGDYAVTIDG